MRQKEYKKFSKKNKQITVAVLAFAIAIFGFLLFSNKAEAANRYRVGAGNWNTTSSWSTTSNGSPGASIPGSADIAIFEATSTASMTLDAAVNVSGIQIDSGYTGTITQGAVTITVGAGGWTQNGGKFAGSASSISINGGAFTQTGGVATSTSGTLTITNGNFTISGGTFNHNNGTTTISATASVTIDIGSAQLNNLQFNNDGAFTINGTTTVAGNLIIQLAGSISAGTGAGAIEVYGNVSTNDITVGGTADIIFVGSSNQTISGTASGDLPSTGSHVVNKTSGTVTLASSLGNVGSFTVQSGNFNITATAATFSSFTQTGGVATSTSGTLTINNGNFTISGGTFNHNNGTTTISNTATIDIGTTQLKNLQFGNDVTFTINGTTTVAGNLIIDTAGTINVGTGAGAIEVYGNVTTNDTTVAGTADIIFVGSSNQTISGTATGDLPSSGSHVVNKTSGTVTLASSLGNVGSFTVQSGNFNITANSISVSSFTQTGGIVTSTPGTLTISGSGFTISGGTFNHNNGTTTITGNTTIDIGTTQLKNLSFNGCSTSCVINGTTTVSGDLTIGDVTNISAGTGAGAIEVYGNVTTNGTTVAGNADIVFAGGSAQTLGGTSSGDLPATGSHIINKTSGTTVTLAQTLGNVGSFTVSSGTLSLSGYNFSPTALTIQANGNLQLQGGETLTAPTLNTGSTVTYNGTAASYNLKNYSYKNLTIAGGASSVFNLATTTSGLATTTISSGILSTATSTGFNISGTTLVNNDTLRLYGTETISFTNWDTDSGTVEYVGRNIAETLTVKDFGATDYYNLKINDTNTNKATFSSGAAKNIAGTLTVSSGTYNANGQTTGVTGLTTVNGGTYQASTSTQTFTGGLTVSSGTFTGSSGTVTIPGALTLSGGTFNAATSTINIAGNLTQTGGTFTYATSTVVFDGSGNQTASSTSFYNLTVNKSNGTTLSVGGSISTFNIYGALTLSSSTFDGGSATVRIYKDLTNNGGAIGGNTLITFFGTDNQQINGTQTNQTLQRFQLNKSGGALSVGGSINTININATSTLSAGTFNSGTSTINAYGNWVSNGGLLAGSSTVIFASSSNQTISGTAASSTFYNFQMNKTAGSLGVSGAAGGTININGTSTLSAGTFNAGTSTINVAGNWVNNGGSFQSATSTVAFTNNTLYSTSTISGENTFYNLTKNVTATSTLQFPVSATTTIANTLTLTGTSTGKLFLRSSSDGTQWKIDAQGTRTMSNLNVKDSNNVNAANMDCLDGCDDNPNTNTNWRFGMAGEFDPTYGVNGVSVYQATSSDPDNWGKVKIQYKVKDLSVMPAGGQQITPSFSYSTSSGATWNSIASGALAAGDLDVKSISTSSWSILNATWSATTTIPDFYSTATLLKVTISDTDKPANAEVNATSTIAVLNTTKPSVASSSLKINGSSGAVNATTSQVTLALQNITGDSSGETVYVQFATGTSPTVWYGADSGGGAVSTSTPNGLGSGMNAASSTITSWTWTLGVRTEILNVRVRDAYNNIATTTATSTASWNNTPEFQNTIITNQITNNADANWGKVKVDYIVRDSDTSQNSSSTMQNFTQISLQYSTGTPWTTWTNISRTYLTGATGTEVSATVGKISISESYPGASSTIYWNAVGQLGNYAGNAQVRVTIDDTEAIFNSASSTSATISNLDAERPSFSSFTAGSASTNNVQFTDADADGVADNRNMTLRLNNLVESSSSTQGVYVLFSNDGTNYGASTDSNGAVSAVATSSIANWEYISGGSVAGYSKANWYLSASGSRSKIVYALVKDAYGNDISSAASASVTWNKRPQFSAGTISDTDNSSILSASSTSGVMVRQCDLYDTDSNCSAGKIKIIYAPRDPDANESGLATKGQLSTTFDYSTNGTNWTAISALTATTTVATSSADVAGGYNPVYSTTTTYWDASALGSQSNLRVRVTVNDNEAGANTASSTSNIIAYDKTNPSGNNITFDAGVAGATGSASITIPWWSDATSDTATNTIQYAISDTSTNSSSTATGWTTVAKNATTTRIWTFDSDIEVKSLDFNFRDIYGNIYGTTTVSTIAPADPNSFLVQDVSKVQTGDWKLYIGWGLSTSTSFSSYVLEYATSSSSNADTLTNFSTLTNAYTSSTNYYVHNNLSSSTYHRYRLGVRDTDGDISVRSTAGIIAKADGIQNFQEGGGGVSSKAAVVENVIPSQSSNGNVAVNYKITDGYKGSKSSPSYETYLFYDIGAALAANPYNSGAGTLTLLDSSRLPQSGFVQINNEVIKYTSNTTSTGVLGGLTRGAWPTAGTSRASRQNTAFFEGTPVWLKATSTSPVSITDNTISGGQSETITWNTYYEPALAGASYGSVGIRPLVHDNQDASIGPLSSQNDYSENGILGTLDLTAPTIQFSATSASGTESNASPSFSLVLSRPYPYNSSANFNFSGTATSSADYNASSSATITAGATSTTISLSIINDSTNESNETIIILLSSPTNASIGASSTYTYTINDNDNATISFANATSSNAESIATATISLVLPSASGQDVTVNYSFGGTASPTSTPADYSTSTAQTATIASGNTSTTISLAINNDTTNEEDETIIISLSGPSNATLGATTTYTLTIIDDDNSAPQFSTTTLVSVDRVATSSDVNFGKAIISYSVRDIDTNVALNSANRYKITPSFEFNIGNGWQNIASSSIVLSSSTDSVKHNFDQSVALTDYQIFTAAWSPTSTSAATGVYSSSTQIRITLSDGEAKNSTSTATSTLFTLDTKTPTATFIIDSSNDTINLTVVENSSFQYRVSNNSDLSSDGVNASSTIVGGNWNSVSATSTYSATSSWIFASSTYEKVYFEAKDAFNNITTSTIVAPYTPLNFAIKDITNASLSRHQEFLSWDAYTATTSAAFGSYQIYRATSTGGVYSLLTSITNINTVNYTDANLSSSTTYYYKMRIADSDGDASGYSSVVNDQPDGADDTTAPVLSGITATPNTTWASIVWTANELSDSIVEYGLSSGSYIASSTSATLIASTTAHEVVLNNLASSTTYYYRVKSNDVSGNQAVSSGSSFATLSGPIISDISCTDATDNSLKIIWNTDINSDSVLNYATSAAAVANASDVGSGIVGESASSTVSGITRYQHVVTLSGLSQGTTYYFRVKSTANSITSILNNNGNYYQCKTSYDTKPPVITNIATPLITNTSAVIIWTTDEPSTSKVEYGIASAATGNYASSTARDNNLTINHAITLTGLTKETKYYYRVQSYDMNPDSPTAVSNEQNFTTVNDKEIVIVYISSGGGGGNERDTTAPQVSNINVSDITSFNAMINFDINEEAIGIVEYGPTTDYGLITAATEYLKKQSVKLNGLRMGTDYHFRIKAIDKSGNYAYSSDNTFSTKFFAESIRELKTLERASQFQEEVEKAIESILPSIVPPFIEEPRVLDITENSAVIKWKTNILSYSVAAYASEKDYELNKAKENPYSSEISDTDNKVVDHELKLSGLASNTKYHFVVKSFSLPKAVGTSKDITFITQASKIKPRIADVDNNAITVVWTTDESASSILEYKNLRTGEINRKILEEKVVDHNVKIENLVPDTSYEIRVMGYNEKGNSLEAGDILTARTSRDVAAPIISNLKIDSALMPGRNDKIQTVVSWKTNELATSIVEYEEGSGKKEELTNRESVTNNFTDNHAVIVTKLKPGSLYRIRVVSVDESGNKAASPIRTIITPRQTESIVDVVVKNFEDTFQFLRKLR